MHTYFYTDGALAAIPSGATRNLLVVNANSPADADALVRQARYFGARPSSFPAIPLPTNFVRNFGVVAFTNAAWDNAARQINVVGGFTDLVADPDAVGLEVIFTAGAGVSQTTVYHILTKNGDNQITLAVGEDINGGAGNIANGVDGYVLMGRAINRIEASQAANLYRIHQGMGADPFGVSYGHGVDPEPNIPGVIFELQVSAA